MFWKLAVVFLFIIVIDILGHALFKIKRRISEWFVLAGIVAGTIICTFGAFRSDEKNKDESRSKLYCAYRYIEDGSQEKAFVVLNEISDDNKEDQEALKAFSYALSGDYIKAYFITEQFLAGKAFGKDKGSIISSLQDICSNQIGIESSGVDAESFDYSFDNYLAYLDAHDSVSEDSTENSIYYEISKLLESYVETIGFYDREKEKFEEDYAVDRLINGEELTYITESEIEDIVKKYGETEEILKLECKYYSQSQRYDKAKETAKKLVKAKDCPEYRVILTDIIADEAFVRENAVIDYYSEKMFASDYSFDFDQDDYSFDEKNEYILYKLDEKDSEITKYLNEADDKYKEAAKIEQKYGYDDAKGDIEKLKAEGEEYLKKANYVQVERAKNYIIAQNPDGKDKTGLYDLELAKLNLTSGNKKEAGVYLYKVIDNSETIEDNSLIKDEVEKVVAEYNAMTSEAATLGFTSAVTQLVDKQSQNIIQNKVGTVNGSFSDYVGNTLTYSKIYIHISKIDTSNYPEISAYVNINGQKDENSEKELASNFTEKDFQLIDTQYEISDFQLISDDKAKDINIALVIDRSYSMEGAPLANAKVAAKAVVDNMDTSTQKLSVVAYNDYADICCNLNSDKTVLNETIDDIRIGTGTNIGAGLASGLDSLSGASGTKAIILMSDGQNYGDEAIVDDALQKALKEGITVYTVVFGDADQEYMERIADYTGGKCLVADSNNLANIYLTLQKYIVNNYCFKYTVTKNVDTDPRFLQVCIPQYNTYDSKDYWIREENAPEYDEDGRIIRVGDDYLSVSAITPGNISVQDAKDGIELKFSGNGFKDITAIEVNGVQLSDIKTTSESEMTAKLKGDIPAGEHSFKIRTGDGRLVISDIMLKVFQSGTTTSVRLGCTTITADTIGRIADDTLIATGNVMINNFIHFSDDITIKVDGLSSDVNLAGTSMVYLGDSGRITGKGKLYLNYNQIVDAGNSDIEKFATKNIFANLFVKDDLIISNGNIYAEIKKDSTDFDQTLSDYDLSIPFLFDVDVMEVKLYSNRLQMDIKELNPAKIIDDIKDSLKSAKERKAEEEAKKKEKANKAKNDQKNNDGSNKKTWKSRVGNTLLKSSANVTVAATTDGLEFGGGFEIDGSDDIKLGPISLNKLGGSFNTLDEDHKYWSFVAEVGFDTIPIGKVGVDSIGIELSSYYHMLDTVKISVGIDGVTFYKVIKLKEVSGQLQGISTLWIKYKSDQLGSDAKEYLANKVGEKVENIDIQDIILSVTAKIEVNLLASAPSNDLVNKLSEWLELGEGEATAEINFSVPEFKISAKMDILKTAEARAELFIGKNGFELSAGAGFDISLWGCSLTGDADWKIGDDWNKFYIGFEADGGLHIPFFGIHYNGDFDADFELSHDFTNIALTFNINGSIKKIWYDENGGPTIFNKIKCSF